MPKVEKLQNRIDELIDERDRQDVTIAKLELEVNQLRGEVLNMRNNYAQEKAKYKRALEDAKYYKNLAENHACEPFKLKINDLSNQIESYRDKLSKMLDIIHDLDRIARN